MPARFYNLHTNRNIENKIQTEKQTKSVFRHKLRLLSISAELKSRFRTQTAETANGLASTSHFRPKFRKKNH